MNGDRPALGDEPVEASNGEPEEASDADTVEALEDVSAETRGQSDLLSGAHPRGDPRDLRATLEETLDADPPLIDADPVEALKRDNRSCEPDWRTAGARWKRLEDISDDVFYRALEALA